MTLFGTPPGASIYQSDEPLGLQLGGEIPELEIAYETYGTLSEAKDNAILLCPAFSASAHARSHDGDPAKGWWEPMIGPGAALDTDRFFVICASLLGGCTGTTGPTATDPRSERPYAGGFPEITIEDIVATHLRLVDHLGIETLHAAVGGSMGGMQSLEIGLHDPERVRNVLSFSATLKTRAFTAMIRHIGRRCIMLDPVFEGGYYEQLPEAGLRLARELGTIFYRSREEFNERFSTDLLEGRHPTIDGISFDFQSYLDHQATKILARFDPNSYLRMSLAMDLHDVARDFESVDEALAGAQARFLIVGVTEDRLIPVDEQFELHEALVAAGKESHWEAISSPIGHDSFLVDFDLFGPIVGDFLAD